jgi:double-stranded uracil-DNA glycosylase
MIPFVRPAQLNALISHRTGAGWTLQIAKSKMWNADAASIILHWTFCIFYSRHVKRYSGQQPLLCGFPPITALDARVLVLGSMPSIASLAMQQYYAHRQNAFWPIMGRLFGAGPELAYEERKRILCDRGVAVWDVLRECHREGSLDTAIRAESEMPNDFVTFLRQHPGIRSIFFNGKKAEKSFHRHALAQIAELARGFQYVRLPSTSPAHAGQSFTQKLAAWSALASALNNGSNEGLSIGSG